MKPYMQDSNQKSIMDIINESDPLEKRAETPLTPGEAKRIELIRKMKNDTDKIEYMVMLNALMISLFAISTWHYMTYRSWISIICMVLSMAYFMYIRMRLRTATIRLVDHKNNFDLYLWEGFHLKEMRYSAVKLAYLIFFPLFCVLLVDVLSGIVYAMPFYVKVLIAFCVSSIGWFTFFGDDREALEAIETDLKALAYL